MKLLDEGIYNTKVHRGGDERRAVAPRRSEGVVDTFV